MDPFKRSMVAAGDGVVELESLIRPKGPRTQIVGFWGPNTIILMAFGP